MSSDHLPILIGLQTTATSSPARHRTCINLKKDDWTGYRQEIERKLSSRYLPTDCQKDEKLFRATLLKSTKLWRTMKGIYGKSKQTTENEGITFTGRPHTSHMMIANSFNRQFTTSKLGKHSSSRRTRQVSKDVKRMSLEEAESLTSDQVTALYNDSLRSCHLPSIWKTSLVTPIPKPGKDSSQGTSYRPISLLCPAAKVLEALILPNYVSDRIDKRNNMLKALAGSS